MKANEKRLSLNKETVTFLNDQEIANLKGGSSWACVWAGANVVAGVALHGQDQSWWACEPPGDGGGGGAQTGGACYGEVITCQP